MKTRTLAKEVGLALMAAVLPFTAGAAAYAVPPPHPAARRFRRSARAGGRGAPGVI